MSKVGAHLSIGKGFAAMAREAVALGCETVQVFSRSPRGGKPRSLEPSDVEQMGHILSSSSVGPLVVHVPYFVNLASEDDRTRGYSVETLALDLVRAKELGAAYVVTHIGHGPSGNDSYRRIARAVQAAFDQAGDVGQVMLLLENSAGQGAELGFRWDEISKVVELTSYSVGACLDTCHAFAAGYEIRNPEGVERLLGEIDSAVGIAGLKLVHANDSVGELGSRLDRHQHIGEGKIGLAAFSILLHWPELRDVPFILETPVDDHTSNHKNLQALKRAREAKLW
ncbi:MAG: deoxyribonuclease IV [Bacillota bacterium]